MSCIESANFEFHNGDELTERFGVLRIKTSAAAITKRPTFILFTIDVTGSMREHATKGITKMEIVKQGFKNIIHYLSGIDAPIYISVHLFSDMIAVAIDKIRITKENASEMISIINNISADGCTDIQLALNSAKTVIEDYKNNNKDHQVAHIFMTDGHATRGSSDLEILNDLTRNLDCGNIFIGFGDDHNVPLLKRLSENKRSFYQYINDFENTALIYGELLHPYLYPCIENLTIIIENGQIYNWKTNTWTDRFEEDILSGQVEKIYHLKASIDAEPIVDVYGNDMAAPPSIELKHLFSLQTSDITNVDLTAMTFRHKTLELLFRSSRSIHSLDIKTVRSEINSLFVQIRTYMDANGKTSDLFLMQLCDDLSIAHSSLKNNNQMLTLSRFTSQGRQQSNVSTPSPPNRRDNGLQRQNTNMHLYSQEEESEDDSATDIDSYQSPMRTLSCYTTKTVLDTMTQIQTPHY